MVYGIGELHLELVAKRIMEKIPSYFSNPLVVFREFVVDTIVEKNEGVSVKIEPRIAVMENSVFTEVNNEVRVVGLRGEKCRAIETIIMEALKNGPRIGEPIIGARIQVSLSKDVSEQEVLTIVTKALSRLRTRIANPQYKFSVSVDDEYLGVVLRELSSRGARITQTYKNEVCEVEGMIPVLSSLGLATRLRDLSRGHASIQLEFAGFKLASRAEEEKIVKYLASRGTIYTGPFRGIFKT